MRLTAVAAPAASVPNAIVDDASGLAVGIDEALVPGLRLPSIPGLPDSGTPGTAFGAVPAPPSRDSIAGKADLAAVRVAQKLRTPAGNEWALRMAKDGTHRIWFDLARRHRAETGKVQGWLDTALLAATLAANTVATQALKWHFRRDRPFQVDPSITPVVPKPSDRSYPSGHSSAAFAAARVIAALEPALAKEAYSLATQVAVSRVYAGVHFPTDVVVGALLGTGVAEKALSIVGRSGRAGLVDAVAGSQRALAA